jgi:pilus assembly protein CpaF
MADQVTLSIETPGVEAQRFAIDAEGEITIGRDDTCTVVLASPDISRRHITLEVNPTFVLVHDSSSNGTRVGEIRVHKNSTRVPFGTPMFVGPYIVRVEGMARNGHAAVTAAAPTSTPGPSAAAAAGMPALSGVQTRAPSTNGQPTTQGQPPPVPTSARNERPNQPAPPSTSSHASATGGVPVGGPTGGVSVQTRKKIHRQLLENLDLASLDRSRMDEKTMRPRVRDALKRIIQGLVGEVPKETDLEALINEMTDEALGLGPLEHFLADGSISEIMVVDSQTIFIEKKGRLVRADARFTDDEAVRAVIERIVTPLGRRIDESTPLVDARLKDGSRVNAIIKPLALKGSCITIRKFAKTPLGMPDLVKYGSMTDQMGRFLQRTVMSKKNIVISGGTGSGKTTLLNVLSAAIPGHERIVTIEDAAELQLPQPHVVSLESRPPNMEGKGEYTIRDLVKNALRMRPDRIVVGECRGGEALDMLQAMNTGHDGSLTTTHANSPREAIARLETLCLMSGLDLPSRAIREQIANSVHVVVQQSRFNDGSRRVTNIAEVVGIDDNGEVELRDIFVFVRTGTKGDGGVIGEYRATGYLPSYLDQFISLGLVKGKDYL